MAMPISIVVTYRSLGVVAFCMGTLTLVYLGIGEDEAGEGVPILEPEPIGAAQPVAESRPALSLQREELAPRNEVLDSGVIRGQVTGLPAFAYSYAHPALGVVLTGQGSPKRHVLLDAEGRFVVDGLKPSTWTVAPYKGFSFRFPKWSTTLKKDGTAEVVLAARTEIYLAFELEVDQAALGFQEFVPWRVHIQEAFKMDGGRDDGVADLYERPLETIRTSVFEGRIEFQARLSLRGRTPVFPRLEARHALEVGRDLTEKGAIPVKLTFAAPGHLIRLSGRVEAGGRSRRSPYKLAAVRRDGRKVVHQLRPDPEGRFEILVAVDQLSGPQVTVTAGPNKEALGPFALSHQDLDLGGLSFTKQEVATDPLPFSQLFR